MATGVAGDAGARAAGQQKARHRRDSHSHQAEALCLYGLIVALILSQQPANCSTKLACWGLRNATNARLTSPAMRRTYPMHTVKTDSGSDPVLSPGLSLPSFEFPQ